jgi:hypothetical protein
MELNPINISSFDDLLQVIKKEEVSIDDAQLLASQTVGMKAFFLCESKEEVIKQLSLYWKNFKNIPLGFRPPINWEVENNTEKN